MHTCMSTHTCAHKIVVHESFISLLHFFLQNPLQVVVNAIINSGPREDSTRIGRAGTVRRQAVDVSPLRRVNQAMWLLCTGAREAAFRNIKTIAECLADELINAAKVTRLVSTLRPSCFNIMTIAERLDDERISAAKVTILVSTLRTSCFKIMTIAERLGDERINAAKVTIFVSLLRPSCFSIKTIAECLVDNLINAAKVTVLV